MSRELELRVRVTQADRTPAEVVDLLERAIALTALAQHRPVVELVERARRPHED